MKTMRNDECGVMNEEPFDSPGLAQGGCGIGEKGIHGPRLPFRIHHSSLSILFSIPHSSFIIPTATAGRE